MFALSSEKNAPGYKSHFYDGMYDVPNGRDDPKGCATGCLRSDTIIPLPPVLFPTRDLDILFLHQFRERLSPFFLIAQTAGNAVPRLLDKAELAKIASALSIAVPKTVACSSSRLFKDKEARLNSRSCSSRVLPMSGAKKECGKKLASVRPCWSNPLNNSTKNIETLRQ